MRREQLSRHSVYKSLMADPNSRRRTIGIISCKILRERQEYNKEWLKVLDFMGDFRGVVQRRGWRLAATGGTFDRIPNAVKDLPEYRHRLHGLAPSALGVIQLANLAVYDRLLAVTFFNHMEDLYADSPQNLCLRRICNHFSVPLLEDISSIEYVFDSSDKAFKDADVLGKRELDKQLQQHYGPTGLADNVITRADFARSARTKRSRETIAVVAHDGRKMSMLEFCLRHAHELLSYRRVVSTGTTGRFLRAQMEAYLRLAPPTPTARREWGWAAHISVEDFLRRKIHAFESGPRGGDVQISAKVIDGTCHRVLFFQDPQSSHPHQFDIRLMEKAVQDPETAALFATCEGSAEIIV